MPPIVGDRLVKESSRRYVHDAMKWIREAMARQEGRREVESKVGKLLEDVMVRSEELEAALARAQAEAVVGGGHGSTVRSGIQGVINDNRGRIYEWENVIKYRDGAAREDFLWKTWDWLSQSLTWLQSKA